MSEIVSTLLLVAIVVSLGVLVFTFASGSLSSLTGGFTGLISSQGNAISENFVVEQVAFSLPSGANVYVRNVGTIASTLVSVYVVDQSTGAFVQQFALTPSPGIALNANSVVNIPLTFSSSLSHGHSYSFTVTSILGNSVIFYAKAS